MSVEFLRKVWRFVWYEESVASWIVNVVLAFVLIKFVVYPLLGFALGTPFPIVAVVSSSMEHDGWFDEWWSGKCQNGKAQQELYWLDNISKEDFVSYSFRGGFNKGDIMVLYSPTKISIGDVIVFRADHRFDPIIHRVVSFPTSNSFKTKGDHNCGTADFESNISRDRVVGKAVFRVPVLGWIKIIFVEILALFGIGGL